MSAGQDEQVLEKIVERVRTNVRAAGIPITDDDIQGMIDKGFLANVVAFEAIAAQTPTDLIPDYLKGWGEDGAPPAPTAAAPAGSAERAPATEREPGYETLTEVAARLRTGEVSPVELTQQALDRIAERDGELNSFQLVLADEALAAAREAEREIAAGNWRGPLHGVPVAVKDLLAMKGTVTTAGSKILADWVTDFDAAAVERLREAGAVIVGKTRMSEFAYSPGSNNAHYGPTPNPWNREHDSAGSSSGSGAAVADGMVYGALGSDTGGSIRMPAGVCGIVGLKPTFGRVSLYGAVTLSWSLDHLGPMTRSVRDAAAMLQILAGHDPRDLRARAVPVPDYSAQLDAGVAGLRIGVLREDGSGMPLGTDEALAAWRAGLAALERNGAELVEIDIPEMQALRVLNSAIIAMEAATYHEPNLRERLDDFGDFMRHRVLSAYGYGPLALVKAQQARAALRRRLDAIFERVDLLSTPTLPYGAPRLGDPSRNTVFTSPFNALGWPAITVPVGRTAERLPLGLQLAGRPWDEVTVLRAAAVIEADGPWPGGKP
nr:MAG: Asp-tRNA(Asn)/Glu-tRNA(Gln) amidotransferase GatCAB subunit A [Sphaerobacter thermophilus]